MVLENSYQHDKPSSALPVSDELSIALIGPDEERRRMVSGILSRCRGVEVREYSVYPPSLDDVVRLLEQDDDVILIDLDSDPEFVLDLVESICAKSSVTVMLYSTMADPVMLVRCMHAGAREFFTLPLAQETLLEALVRASARRSETRTKKRAGGKLQVFWGAKGGEGVTTLACNFAVAVTEESKQDTLLIDLDLPLGDVALNLGITSEYSTINALQEANRLDANFLSSMVVKHSSGLFVLAAPGKFPQFKASDEAVDRLIEVALRNYSQVIVDAGSRLDLMNTVLFKERATVYLVVQASIAGLRNANRLITQLFLTRGPNLQIVINRYEPRAQGVTEEQIARAITKPVQWKIPNDYPVVRRMHQTAIPFVEKKSSLSRQIRLMARAACELPVNEKEAQAPQKELSAEPEKESNAQRRGFWARLFAKDAAPEPSLGKLLAGKNEAPPASASPAAQSAVTEVEDTGQLLEGAAQSGSLDGSQKEDGGDGILAEEEKTNAAPEASEELIEVTWQTPSSISYGTPLSDVQLNATAPVPGTFLYSPAAGTILPAGLHTLQVVFTPDDSSTHETIKAEVALVVAKATPVITWPAPAPISCGTALSATELNASTPIPGRFVYLPAAGAVLAAGTHTPSVLFTPFDTENYTAAQANVSLVVTRKTPIITWSAPAPISCGTALSAAELNATATVPGRFVYTPAEGEVLPAGSHTLSVTFTPDDTLDYDTADATVPLAVNGEPSITITWPTPADISYGTALSSAQLNAEAPAPGTFVYTPAAGTVLPAGRQTLTVAFTPAEATDYKTVKATVSIVVEGLPNTVPPLPAANDADDVHSEPAQTVWNDFTYFQPVNRT